MFALHQPRGGGFEQRGLVELKVADVRQRFTLLKQPPSLEELRDRLAERFDRREQSEAERIERLLRSPAVKRDLAGGSDGEH